MANTPRLFEDLSRVASGAMGTVVGMRDEAEAQLRQRLERVLERMDVVPREEFEAVRAMAAKARDEQEAMADRLAALESRLADLEKTPAARPAVKRAPTKGGSAGTGGAKRAGPAKAGAKGAAAKGSGRGKTAAKGGAKAGAGTEG